MTVGPRPETVPAKYVEILLFEAPSGSEIYKYTADNDEGIPYFARRIHGVEQTPTIEGQFKDNVLVRY